MALFKNDKHADIALIAALSAAAFAAGMSFRSARPPAEDPRIGPISLPDSGNEVLPPEPDVSRAGRTTNSRFWGGLAMFTLVGLLVVCSIGFLTWYGNPGTVDRAPKSFDAWLSDMSGWVDPATSLVVAFGVIALIITINASVSSTSTQGSISDQVAISYWRTVLTMFSFVASVFVFVVSCMAWMSVVGEPKSAKGAAAISTVAAIGCLVAAASIAFNNNDSVTRRRTLTQTNMKKDQLTDRLEKIFPGGGLTHLEPELRVVRVLVRLIAIPTVTALVGFGGVWAVYAGEIRWVELLPSLWVGAFYVVVVVWLATYLRWSTYHRWKDWSPQPVSTLWTVTWITVAALLSWDSEGWAGSIIVIGLAALLPSTTVVLAWPKRTLGEPLRWVQWFGLPLWYEIGKSLESQIKELEVRAERLGSAQARGTDPLVSG